ncbi:MAG: glucosaminidase domain-containing protein [Selenomonadaceae bacterium]|nr:glucosaminidase domain-containing protein [Selenomonadaceae bacterium]
METKVEMHQTLPGGTTVSDLQRRPLKERIQEILNAPPEVEEPVQAAPAARVPVTQSVYDASIVGTPLATPQQCVKYLLRVNPCPDISVSPEELVSYYYEEGQREGIRPDVAFAQALKETGFFRYGGTVTPDQNNYCGLGTTSATVKGAYFASSKMGVRAHIQHLLAYASTRTPVKPVVDPRYELVRSTYGERTLNKWQDLNGRWAVPGNSYGQSILSMFRAIVNE